MYNIIVLADHNIGYDICEFLLLHHKKGGINILSIYTNPRPHFAWWKSIETLKSKVSFNLKYFIDNKTFLEEISSLQVDYILFLSWKHIMRKEIISYPKQGCINLHYSLLPRYRGVYPVSWPIIKGEEETGVSFHWVNDQIDQGDIIAQKKVKIESWDTCRTLLEKIDIEALNLFKELIEKIGNWKNIKYQQLSQNASYFSKNDFESSNLLDLEKTYKVQDLINLMRGKTFDPYGKNLYFVDKDTGRKVYISINLNPSES